MRINEAGLNLIKHFEGLRLKAYQDQRGIWTIGYGHTGADVEPDMEINEAMAETLLQKDLHHAENGLTAAVRGPVSSNQFSALVSFAFNVGLHACISSHLMGYVNSGDFEAAANQFPLWDKCAGQVDAGLLKRREAEEALFRA